MVWNGWTELSAGCSREVDEPAVDPAVVRGLVDDGDRLRARAHLLADIESQRQLGLTDARRSTRDWVEPRERTKA